MKKETSIQIAISVLILIIMILTIRDIERPKIDLPEEYELIAPDTPIQGEFKNGTLTIEFKH